MSLLEDCRSYFQRAQASWDQYFTKWETLAEKENKEYKDSVWPVETLKSKRVDTIARKLCKKSISVLNRKSFKSSRKRKTKWKRGRVQGGKARHRKRETEIIHTSENQTNLECEVLNNKHFEADLKAIFIEILSENTNKMGMFSVLSRTFSGTGKTISNFSLSSMIMEKNGFSISPVSKTVLHSASRNEFPLGGIPRGEISYASGRSCVNLTQQLASNVHILQKGHFLGVNRTHLHNRFRQENHQLITNDVADNTDCEKYLGELMLTNCDSPRPGRINASTQASYSSQGFNHKTRFDSRVCLLPEITSNKILETSSTSENIKTKYLSEKVKTNKRRVKSTAFKFSDDYSEDEDDDVPGGFLKIFCTPKRPKRCINQEERVPETVINDDDDYCFRIFDRVKTDKV